MGESARSAAFRDDGGVRSRQIPEQLGGFAWRRWMCLPIGRWPYRQPTARGRAADVHHVADAGVHDDRVGREPAQRADDGRLRPDVRVPVPRAGDHLPAAAGARRGGARVGLDGRRLPLGERGDVAALGPAGGVVPVRDDDLLLPDAAGVRREHAGLHLQPRPGGQRRLHRHRDRHRVLARRVHVGARRHRRDRQARLQRAARRHADPGRGPGHPRRHLPAAGQHVGRADGREPPDPRVDRDREPRADRQQLPVLLGHGDELGARLVAEGPRQASSRRRCSSRWASCC